MSGRIITARHGRPNLARDVKITARDYGDWWARYDQSGLHPDEIPPPSLVELASRAKVVLSSTLPRAIDTAREVTQGARAVPADPIFVEAPLPPPPVPALRLSPGQWGVISRAFWVLGFAPAGVEPQSETWRRIDQIVLRLEDHARDGDVLLCAHGYLNWMIDRRLSKGAWRRAAREGGNHYWSWRVYEPRRSRARQTAQTASAPAE